MVEIEEFIRALRRGVIPAIRKNRGRRVRAVREAFVKEPRLDAFGVNTCRPFVSSERAGEDECAEAHGHSVLVFCDRRGVRAGEQARGGEVGERGFVEHHFVEAGVHAVFESGADVLELLLQTGDLNGLGLLKGSITLPASLDRVYQGKTDVRGPRRPDGFGHSRSLLHAEYYCLGCNIGRCTCSHTHSRYL